MAKGVLSSAITVNWKPPTTNNGSVIARFILEYEIEGDGPYRRAFDPLTEGCQISNLMPGQKVVNSFVISFYKLMCDFNFVPCRAMSLSPNYQHSFFFFGFLMPPGVQYSPLQRK